MPVEISHTELYPQLLVYMLLGALTIAVYFALKSGDKYSVEDAENDAENFAGVISEADGPLTTFLIIAFIVLIVWAVAYLILNM
ncbi:MAG: hypothetical protein OIN89_05650 [Candidatus Methanoperedens sp.]|nr:hypothetical protein [Candidatus Methanoperedens sp.]